MTTNSQGDWRTVHCYLHVKILQTKTGHQCSPRNGPLLEMSYFTLKYGFTSLTCCSEPTPGCADIRPWHRNRRDSFSVTICCECEANSSEKFDKTANILKQQYVPFPARVRLMSPFTNTHLSHCCHILPWLCVWDVCCIIFCYLLHIHSGKTGNLFPLCAVLYAFCAVYDECK